MKAYRPVGYCTVCRRPILHLTDLSKPCGEKIFGTTCNGKIVSVLDPRRWMSCPKCSDNAGSKREGCSNCGGSGWIPTTACRDSEESEAARERLLKCRIDASG